MRAILTATAMMVVGLCGCSSGPTGGTGGGGGTSIIGGGSATFGGGTGGSFGGGTGGTGGGTGGATGGGTGGATGGGTGGGSSGAGLVTFDTFAFYRPVLLSGSDGVLHLAFHTNTSPSTVQYARCAADCGVGANWAVAIVGTDEFTGSVRMVIGADARLHLLYDVSRTAGAAELIYATCAGNCTQPASWTKTNLASLFGGGWNSPTYGAPLVIDAQGRLTFTVDRKIYANGAVTLATCASGCSTVGNWSVGNIRAAGARTALAASGITLHQLIDNDMPSVNATSLAYRVCAGNCTQEASWQELPNLFIYDGRGPVQLVTTAQGGVRVAYNQGTSDASQPANIKAQDGKLIVWGCDANCTQLSSWTGFITGVVGDGQDGLALAEQAGSMALYISNSDRAFVRACSAGCLDSANWQAGDLDTAVAMTAEYDPFAYSAVTCSGARPQSATWHFSQAALALRPDGSAAFAHTASILRTCPGGTSVVYVPGFGRVVFVP